MDLLGAGDISPNNIGRLIITDGYTTSIASFDNQICYNHGFGASASGFTQNIVCVDRNSGSVTLRIGKSAAAIVKGGVQMNMEEEGILASSAFV